ncbi:MAG TPA: AAA family ATPase [Ktedonobacteraceae bacterium]|nr:AAA family ATPase [Ktedonobacteraceae bacterium]
MRKIAIIGSSGAGKTTLARELGEILQIEVIHLDRFFWRKNWTKKEADRTRKKQKRSIQKYAWIMDGSYHDTLELRLKAADTVIFLDMPRLLCVWRVITRHFSRSPRPDLQPKCSDRLDWAFIKKVWDFPRVDRPILISKIQNLGTDQQVIWLHSRKAVKNYLREVREKQAVPERQMASKFLREVHEKQAIPERQMVSSVEKEPTRELVPAAVVYATNIC